VYLSVATVDGGLVDKSRLTLRRENLALLFVIANIGVETHGQEGQNLSMTTSLYYILMTGKWRSGIKKDSGIHSTVTDSPNVLEECLAAHSTQLLLHVILRNQSKSEATLIRRTDQLWKLFNQVHQYMY